MQPVENNTSASNITISVRVKPSEPGQRDGFAEGRGAITQGGKRIEMLAEMGTASGGSSSSAASVASSGSAPLQATVGSSSETSSGRTVVKAFAPAYVFGQEADQQAVYETAARDLVLGILAGRNAALIAYGQTGQFMSLHMRTRAIAVPAGQATPVPTPALAPLPSALKCSYLHVTKHRTTHNHVISRITYSFSFVAGSGKTHTMLGEPHSASPNAGVIPRALSDLFNRMEEIKQEESSKPNTASVTTELRASYIEIYQEQPYDLLALHAEAEDAMVPSSRTGGGGFSATARRGALTHQNSSSNLTGTSRPIVDEPRKVLKIREFEDGFFLEDCKQVTLRSPAHALDVLHTGFDLRRTASTAMNARSSRSHAILSLQAEVRIAVREEGTERTSSRIGVLDVVDLAGSERQRDTGAEGAVIREAGKINQSLGALADVIKCSVDNTLAKHSRMVKPVPWRNSKLTMLLKRSLSGNSRTAMIFTISPALDYWSESLATLAFADRARKMKTDPTTNEKTMVTGSVAAMANEIAILKARLAQAQAAAGQGGANFGTTYGSTGVSSMMSDPAMFNNTASSWGSLGDEAGDADAAARRIDFDPENNAPSAQMPSSGLTPQVQRHIAALTRAADTMRALQQTSASTAGSGSAECPATPDFQAIESASFDSATAGMQHVTSRLTAQLAEVSTLLLTKTAEAEAASSLLGKTKDALAQLAGLGAEVEEEGTEERSSKRQRRSEGATDVSEGRPAVFTAKPLIKTMSCASNSAQDMDLVSAESCYGAASVDGSSDAGAAEPAPVTSLKDKLKRMGAVALPGFGAFLGNAAAQRAAADVPPPLPQSPEQVQSAAAPVAVASPIEVQQTVSAAASDADSNAAQVMERVQETLAAWRASTIAEFSAPLASVAGENAHKDAIIAEYRSAGQALKQKYESLRQLRAEVQGLLALVNGGDMLRTAAQLCGAMLQERRQMQAHIAALNQQLRRSKGQQQPSTAAYEATVTAAPVISIPISMGSDDAQLELTSADSAEGVEGEAEGEGAFVAAGNGGRLEVKPREPKLLKDTHFLRLFNQGAAKVTTSTRISLQPPAQMYGAAFDEGASVTASRSDSLSSIDREALMLAHEDEMNGAAHHDNVDGGLGDVGAADSPLQLQHCMDEACFMDSGSARPSTVSCAPSTLSIGTSISARIERDMMMAATSAQENTGSASSPVRAQPAVSAAVPAPSAVKPAAPAAAAKPVAKPLASFIKTTIKK